MAVVILRDRGRELDRRNFVMTRIFECATSEINTNILKYTHGPKKAFKTVCKLRLSLEQIRLLKRNRIQVLRS